MFVREKRNRSEARQYSNQQSFMAGIKYLRPIGCSATTQQKNRKNLFYLAKQEIKNVAKQRELFVSKEDSLAESLFETLSNSSIRIFGTRNYFR